jgi:adenylate kinase family enzyme
VTETVAASRRLAFDALAEAARIHVIGGPGVGKSTLARRLSDLYGLPLHPLDDIAYHGPEFRQHPVAWCEAHAERIAAGTNWIAEGIFVGWTEPLLRRADAIIWLDYADWRLAAARIIGRTVRGAAREAAAREGRERFLRIEDYRRNLRHLRRVLRESRDFWATGIAPGRYPVTRGEIAEALSKYSEKVLHLAQRGEIYSLDSALNRLRK